MPKFSAVFYFFLTPLLLADEKASSNTIERLLPDGTEMKGIKIPRYNENYECIAFLQASLIKKISNNHLSISDLELEQNDTARGNSYSIQLKSANYNPSSGIIESQQALNISAASSSEDKESTIEISGNGIISNIDSQQALIRGPVHCKISLPQKEIQPSQEKANMNPKKVIASTTAAAAIIATVDGSPGRLSPEKAADLDSLLTAELVAPSFPSPEVLHYVNELDPTAETKVQKELKAFLAQPGISEFIQAAGEKKEAVPEVVDDDVLNITCEGDKFFDLKKGILSFQKNIKIREPRLSIDCKKELIVHQLQDPKKDKKNKLGIDKIVAIGDVQFSGEMKDEETGEVRKIKGYAAIVEIDYQKKVTILKGGTPYIEVTQDETWVRDECLRENQWIVIKSDGGYRIDGGSRTEVRNLRALKKNQ